ncbi:ABC transporter substrate-binding protein [Clostridium rectalis]|uniref:ABC transporter substrate-binding protein n=1 Tax=Clostridium rectalis TaxID=2040295 RepID=UPI000F63BBB5|nr:ABC transporter substrate-binding protein [Clostridium rectalis]
MKKNLNCKKIISVICMILMLGSLLTACSKNKKNNGEDTSKHESFELKTYNKTVKYKKVPERVVSFNAHTTENLFALGLEDKIIGTSYNNAEILPQYKEKFKKIPIIAEKYPSMEALLGVNPDFVYGRNSAFVEKGVGTVKDFIDNDIMVYVSKATYTEGATIEDTYEDFYNLGKIFNVEEKAEKIVKEMKNQIESVQNKISKIDKKLRVFVYDSGDDQAFTAGNSLESNIIELAGGENIFGGLKKTWERVNWEAVVEENPQCIVINDYENISAENKIKFLRSNKALKDVDAIKNNKFVVLPLPSVFTGIRNGDAVENLAKGFYPVLFN